MKELPTRQKEAVVLTVLADLELSEVSEIMGISESSVKTHKARGLSRLEEIIKQRALAPSQSGTEEPVAEGIA